MNTLSPVHIVDGDTFDALAGETLIRVRLSSIDTPERRQPFYREASEALRSLLDCPDVRMLAHGLDRDGRVLATVWADGREVNRTLVYQGLAWRFDRYSTSVDLWSLQLDARESHRGLWADPRPIPPWDWRKGNR